MLAGAGAVSRRSARTRAGGGGHAGRRRHRAGRAGGSYAHHIGTGGGKMVLPFRDG